MTKKRRSNRAVSEVVGVILLLGITLGLFAFLNYVVFSFSFEPSAPSVNLVASIDKTTNNIIIEHNGGESLDGNTVITIANETKILFQKSVSQLTNSEFDDSNPDNNKWNFGEIVQYYYGASGDKNIRVTVMDPSTNALILSVIQ